MLPEDTNKPCTGVIVKIVEDRVFIVRLYNRTVLARLPQKKSQFRGTAPKKCMGKKRVKALKKACLTCLYNSPPGKLVTCNLCKAKMRKDVFRRTGRDVDIFNPGE